MSFMNFFRKSKQTLEPVATASKTQQEESPVKYIDRNLFVDEEGAIQDRRSLMSVNPLESFLHQDFELIGFQEGYSYPEAEFMNGKLKVLRSDFRLSVDRLMDTKRLETGELRLQLIKITGISAIIEEQLKERIKQVEIQIHELDTQKILSIEGEGIVSGALHHYRIGFIKGVERYQQEKFFASSTGLFNQQKL